MQAQADVCLLRCPGRAQAKPRSIQIAGKRYNVAFKTKQWTVVKEPAASTDDTNANEAETEVASYAIVNLSEDGRRRFYQVVSGQFGEPIMHPEPDRALALPSDVAYVHASSGEALTPKGKISGILLKNAAGEIVGRYSLTNAAEQGIGIKLYDDGSLTVDGEKYYLRSLLTKDKNRILNFDGFFSEEPQAQVKVWELADLPL